MALRVHLEVDRLLPKTMETFDEANP